MGTLSGKGISAVDNIGIIPYYGRTKKVKSRGGPFSSAFVSQTGEDIPGACPIAITASWAYIINNKEKTNES